MSGITEKRALSKETSILEEPLSRLDGRSLQRLLRDIDPVSLTAAISGASGKIQARVLINVSKKLAVTLIDEMNVSGIPDT